MDTLQAGEAVGQTKDSPEANAAAELASLGKKPEEPKPEPKPEPHYALSADHRKDLIAQGYTDEELNGALAQANVAWDAAPANAKPVGLLSAMLQKLAASKGKPVDVKTTLPKPGKAVKAPAKVKAKAAKKAAAKAKPEKASAKIGSGKPGSLVALTAAEKKERRLEQKRIANAKWREKHGGGKPQKPTAKPAAPKAKAPAAPKKSAKVVKGAKGTFVIVAYDQLNTTEKAVLGAITGVTPEVATARPVKAIASDAFPDMPPPKAQYTVKNGLRRLVKSGLVDRVAHGAYKPTPRAFSFTGKGVLNEAEAAAAEGTTVH